MIKGISIERFNVLFCIRLSLEVDRGKRFCPNGQDKNQASFTIQQFYITYGYSLRKFQSHLQLIEVILFLFNV